MDGFLWRGEDTDRAGVYFDGEFEQIRSFRDGDVLVCEAVLSGKTVRFEMSEKSITIHTADKIRFVKRDGGELEFRPDRICAVHNGCAYEVGVTGECAPDGTISPTNGRIVFDMSI